MIRSSHCILCPEHYAPYGEAVAVGVLGRVTAQYADECLWVRIVCLRCVRVSVYLCVYVCICVCVFMCVCVYLCECVRVLVWFFQGEHGTMCPSVRICVHVCRDMRMCEYACM